MQTQSTSAAGQGRLAWRLFIISAIINVLLATGVAICGCYSAVFSDVDYIAADSRLHFTRLERIGNIDESSLELVDHLYKGDTDGSVPEKKDGESGKEEDSATKTGQE